MSIAHPIISVTGSSGAGTTSVKRTFEQIFRREGVNAAYIEGDAFHRYDRSEMKRVMAEEATKGNYHFSHFGPDANLLDKLEEAFRDFSKTGTATTRRYVHDADEAELHGAEPGTFTAWEDTPKDTDLLFYEGLHGAIVADEVNVAQFADLKIGVVPVVNLEWIQKLHRDKAERGYSSEVVMGTILRRMPDYLKYICDPHGIDFSYLLAMIHGSFMSRANSIVIPGNKTDLAMQLILTPLIMQLIERKQRAA